MRRFLLILSLLLPAAAASDDDYRLHGIKGRDDRVVADSTAFPWRAIGRLNKETGGHCTAAIVAPRLVLTAAHCLWNLRADRWLPPDTLHFVAGWSKETYLAHARGAAIHVSPGYQPATSMGPDRAVHDWALVSLQKEVAEGIGKFEVEALDGPRLAALKKAGTRFMLAGYAQDRREVLLADIGCPLKGFAEGKALLVHGCDAVGGVSGAPVFYQDGETFRIVGVHVATMRTNPESLGLAVPGSAFAAAVRQRGR